MKGYYILLLFFFVGGTAYAQTYKKLENEARFSDREKSLILAGDTSKMMRVTQVTNEADYAILTTVCSDISFDQPLLSLLAKRMYLSVMYAGGVGIAAPQVGINKNLIWVQRFDKVGEPFEFYINPKIVWRSDLLQLGGEGCLSIPELRDDVVRNYAIQLNYTTLDGGNHTEVIEGFTSVIFQHETDHLLGILFPQRVETQNTEEFKKAEEKGKRLIYVEGITKRI